MNWTRPSGLTMWGRKSKSSGTISKVRNALRVSIILYPTRALETYRDEVKEAALSLPEGS